jgi:hypothetical protein
MAGWVRCCVRKLDDRDSRLECYVIVDNWREGRNLDIRGPHDPHPRGQTTDTEGPRAPKPESETTPLSLARGIISYPLM